VSEPDRVLRLAADSPAELAALLAAPEADLIPAGMRLPAPDAPPCRLAVVDPTRKRLALARWAVERGEAWRGRNDVWFSPTPMIGPRACGRVAFLFPGLEDTFAPRVTDVAAHFRLPVPFAGEVDVVGDVGRLAVAVLAVGRLLNDAMHRIGIDPDAVAGHSVGEWTAMVAGGLFSTEDSDRFMATFDPDTVRVPGLAFAALGASAELVTDELAARASAAGTRIVLSHDNAPQQSIVCGPQDEVDAFVLAMRARGILGQTLSFRSGFHTPMLAPYLGPIRQDAEGFEIHRARVPVWSATTAAEFPADEAGVRELFVRHLLEPVRFRPLLNQMYAAGFRAFVQLGVGQVTALVGDTLRDRDHVAVAACSPRRDGLAQLDLVAAALWACGAEPESARLTALVRPDAVEERAHATVRLDLGGATVSLDAGRLPALQAFLRPQPALERRPDLSELGGRFPVLAEFEALMQETERSALALLAAGRDALTTPARSRRPEPPAMPPARRTSVLHVSLGSMPYLMDHSFFSQRPGWPDPRDLFPVVPATAITTHLIEAACAGEPGTVAVAVADLRFEKWVPAIPGHDVEISFETRPDGRLSARFGPYARGVVQLAAAYPPAPARWPVDVAHERRPAITAAELYADRWMFHGPAYQGVTELTAVSDTEIRGVITAPAAPGSLLDNVGHFLGQWIVETQTDRLVVFPTRLSELRFYAPTPPPGSRVSCHLRIVEASEQAVNADVQLCVSGRDGSEVVWAELSGWRERRFDSDLESYNVYLHVERFAHGVRRPGGWVLVQDQWPDLATRDIIMRGYLGAAERETYERQPPRARRGWFLGRLAAKDAVRHLLWADGESDFWPAELAVDNDERGKPYVRGMHGRILPRLEVSIAHCAEAAVAIARPAADLPAGAGVGIDVEEVLARPPETVDFALGRAERELLETCVAGGEPPELWFTRFWTAKEAVAKARGTGLAGRPRDFAVVSANQRQICVAVTDDETDDRSERLLHYRVDLHRMTNRPGLPPRDYVVAVAGNGPTTEEIEHHHRERMTTV
jgi:malonyl CoA-acyl carrier protein transacylase/phosphopantetheinyl transferase